MVYGRVSSDGRTLPQLRRWMRETEPVAHPSAGVLCIGVRDPLVAFNVNLDAPLAAAKRIAMDVRGEHIRALAFELPSRIEYIELSSRADFNDSFIGVLGFPHLDRSDSPDEPRIPIAKTPDSPDHLKVRASKITESPD